MKKKKMILKGILLFTIVCFTVGCGREIEVKNGSKVAVSMGGNKFTATEYYEDIKKDNISILIDRIDRSILEKTYQSDEKEKEAIDKQIEQIKSVYGANTKDYTSIYKTYFGVDSEEELRERLSLEYKRNLAVEDYIKKHLSKAEIQKYYDENIYGQVQASHILLNIEEGKEEETQKTIQTILEELEKGEDFSTLAKKYSQDKATASKGGDLGYFDLDTMPEELQNVLKSLEVNTYHKEAIQTELGYHIIQKTGQKDKPKKETVEDDIKEKLKTEKLQNSNTLYYETLRSFREEKKIKWNDDVLKKAYKEYMDDLIKSVSN